MISRRDHRIDLKPARRLSAVALSLFLGSLLLILHPLSPAPAAAMPALQGEAAVTYLKEQGLYDSLQAALTVAFYPVTIDQTFDEQQKLTASDGAAGDFFGNVAIHGNTVVVGAHQDDVGANVDQGSAYVFVREGGSWIEQQKLTASDGATDDFFANAAVHGNTIVVTASMDDVGSNVDQGSAYVFVREGGSWTEQQKLTASDGAAGDLFGRGVDIHGNTIVVSSSFDDVGSNVDQGSAHVFVREGKSWVEQQKLTASDGAGGDFFSDSVAIHGETIVVGAPADDIGSNFNQGSAYVFVREDQSWVEQQKLTASDGAFFDVFGTSVAIHGETIIVGAFFDDSPNFDQGSAYVFAREGESWTEQQKLTASDGAFNDRFGTSVAIHGETIVVGALEDDVGGNFNQGSAYVFQRQGSSWSEQQKLTASDGAAADFFGHPVAIHGNTIVVAASQDDIGSNVNQGSVYVFGR